MSVGQVHTSELDDFVASCDERGGIANPSAHDWVSDFSLVHDTVVDTTLDGFDPRYAEQQLDLYREVSGRDIDQEANEQSEFDFDDFLNAPNPYGPIERERVAHHARTILTSLIVADVGSDARVLDMGCGWGMSTEMFAFCGCDVTAVDINPKFTELIDRRAAVRGYSVRTVRSAFDDFESDELFDLVFFYECLHHAILPWEVLERVGRNVAPGGKIAFAGEPIQALDWPTWGLRLDAQSVYCIRKFGWFENGWSADFLTACFDRVGFELEIMPRIGFQHTDIGVAVRRADGGPIPSAHWAAPFGIPRHRTGAMGTVERVARGVARRVFR